jgi:hypothetical protein
VNRSIRARTKGRYNQPDTYIIRAIRMPFQSSRLG